MSRREQKKDRRCFLRLTGATTVAVSASSELAGAAHSAGAEKGKHARMKVGCQRGPTSDEMLQYFAQLGVTNICGHLPLAENKKPWTVAEIEKLKKRVESHGISLDMLALPLSSSPIGRAQFPNIMLGKKPERDREIDAICAMIRAAAKAGVPALKYNLTLLGVVRTQPISGRGGCKCSTFVHAKARQERPLTDAGKVSAEMMWERIAYFLQRV